MTTLNTIIEEENTPDMEWEKELRKRYRSQTLKMAREVSQTGDYSKVEGMIVDWWLKELSSRDTYWKERMRKVVEGMQRKKSKIGFEHEGTKMQQIKQRVFAQGYNQALDTLLDNLK